MRRPRPTLLLALATLLGLCAPSPAAWALRGVTGGTGASLTSAPVQPRPVVTTLSVPATASPGPPPRVVLRIDEHGVSRVYAVLAVHDLATGRAAVTLQLGWIATGRALGVRWPAGATLAPGSYRVGVSAHDTHGTSLLRRAHSSGVATLVVRQAAPPAPPAPAAPAAPTPAQPAQPLPEAGVPTPAQTVADGAVFPVAGSHEFGGAENRFGAPRPGGYTHQGQDVLTAEGTPVLAPLAGTITATSYQAGGAGYYAVEHTNVGLDFMFAHCQAGSLSLSTGQAVGAGQQLCRAGQTGDATAPHLHFEMWVGGWQQAGGHPIDPLPYLQAWEQGATSS